MGPSSFAPEKKHTAGQWGSPYNTKFPPKRRFFSTAGCVSPARRSTRSADGEHGNGRVGAASGACRSALFPMASELGDGPRFSGWCWSALPCAFRSCCCWVPTGSTESMTIAVLAKLRILHGRLRKDGALARPSTTNIPGRRLGSHPYIHIFSRSYSVPWRS